jgi:hypothetical protein
MTRRDLCVTLPRPHLQVTPLTLSKPSYQEEKDIATRGTSSHAQPHPGTARDRSAASRKHDLPSTDKSKCLKTPREFSSVVQWLSCLPLEPRFAGSNPAEDDGFF